MKKPKHKDKCATALCRNRRAVHRRRKKCQTCISRERRAANPMKACFWNLRTHARERFIDFDLTLEQFTAWAIKYDYINRRGRHAEGYVIDRRDNEVGYTPENIQCLTNRENVIKQHTVDKIRNRKQMYVDAKIMGHNLKKQTQTQKQ